MKFSPYGGPLLGAGVYAGLTAMKALYIGDVGLKMAAAPRPQAGLMSPTLSHNFPSPHPTAVA